MAHLLPQLRGFTADAAGSSTVPRDNLLPSQGACHPEGGQGFRGLREAGLARMTLPGSGFVIQDTLVYFVLIARHRVVSKTHPSKMVRGKMRIPD